VSVTLDRATNVQRTAVASVAVGHDGDIDLANCLLDFIAHLGHRNVASVGKTVGAGNWVASQEDHGEAGFLDETRGKPVIRAAVRQDLTGVVVSFQHQGPQAAGLNRWDLAPNVLEGGSNILNLAQLASLLNHRRVELERVGGSVDN
jgi:hypothetical protein